MISSRRIAGRRHLFILMYHRVDYQVSPLFETVVRPEFFEKQIAFLKKHFRIIGFDDLDRDASEAGYEEDAVILTFDDGYRDNYLHAFPILRKYKVSATVFLPTDYVGTGRLLWYDRLAWIFSKGTSIPNADVLSDNGISDELSPAIRECFSGTADRRRSALRAVAARIKAVPPQARDRFLYTLAGICQPEPWPGNGDRVMLSWEEVREMSRSGISFGSHTNSHALLSSLSEGEARTEIGGSKRTIEEKIQKRVNTFAYPYGKTQDYRTGNVFRILREEGFDYACSTNRGPEAFPLDNPLELKRRGVATHPYLFL